MNGLRNGIGEEYVDKKLIFRGEYLNGQKNGKGNEYRGQNLIFQGEYLNGLKWNGRGYFASMSFRGTGGFSGL